MERNTLCADLYDKQSVINIAAFVADYDILI